MRGSRIAGLGKYVPDRVVTNDDLSKLMETTDEWIQKRTGIKQRHWVEGDVGGSDLAVPASLQALEQAGIDAKDLDMIVFGTLSPDVGFPGNSSFLQAKLECPGIAILDIRNQCTGFIYGLAIADQFIRSGMMNNILVVGGEVHSSGLDISTQGRDVAVLFGDGAGAAVLTASDDEHRVLGSVLHGDGRHAEILMCEVPASRSNPRVTHEMLDQGRHYPKMDGRSVFRHAVTRMPEAIHEVLAAHDYSLDDVDLLIPHQANLRINEMVARQLKLDPERVYNNIQRYGNTTAASVPIALCEAQEEGRVKPGDLVLLAGFGAGLTWGANLIRW